jgi:hypothetical protein
MSETIVSLSPSKRVSSSSHPSQGINLSFLIEYEDGEKGIWKSEAHETWRTYHIPEFSMAKREVLAYELSQVLGCPFKWMIPPTRLETFILNGKETVGSFQEWVEDFTEASKYNVNEQNPQSKLRNNIDLCGQIYGFDALMGNTDRHTGNYGFNEAGYPILIDNGLMFSCNRAILPYHDLFGWRPEVSGKRAYDAARSSDAFKKPSHIAVNRDREIERLFKEVNLIPVLEDKFWTNAFNIIDEKEEIW